MDVAIARFGAVLAAALGLMPQPNQSAEISWRRTWRRWKAFTHFPSAMPRTSPQTAADALRDTLSKLSSSGITRDDRELERLELNVYDLVDELRGAGMTPEHVIRSLKGIVTEAKLGPCSLLERMVKWSVERYFKQ